MNTLDLIAKHEIEISWLTENELQIYSYKTDYMYITHNGTDEDKARALREAIEEIVN